MTLNSPPPPPLITPPLLSNPASLVTGHSHLFSSRNGFPSSQTTRSSSILNQNQELYIVEAEALTTEPLTTKPLTTETLTTLTLTTDLQHIRDLASLITHPNPYDTLLTMFLGNELVQEENLDPEPSQSYVLAPPDRLTLNKPGQESIGLNNQTESPPDDEGLFPEHKFPAPPSPVTDSFGAGYLELYIQEEGDAPIRSSVFNSINDAPTPEVEHAVFTHGL